MSYELVLPQLGLTMTEGTIIRWLKKEGDSVEKGDSLVEITTDKASNLIESPCSGLIKQILVPAGKKVPVLTTIALIVQSNESIAYPTSVDRAADVGDLAKRRGDRKRIKSSPKARKMAAERNLSLSQIKGSGPSGRIVAKDIEEFVSTSVEPLEDKKGADVVVEMEGMRKIIADSMSKSFHEKPHVTLNSCVDVTKILELHRALNHSLEEGLRIGINDLLIKCAALILKERPFLNSIVDGSKIILRKEINIGLAVSLPDGLVVPVVHSADQLSLKEIAKKTKILIEAARANSLEFHHLEGGTFTISNLGMFGIESFTPIINQPECAILGVGEIKETPVVEEGSIVIRKMMYFSLSFDHRAIDGAQAAQFMQSLKTLIHRPDLIWLY